MMKLKKEFPTTKNSLFLFIIYFFLTKFSRLKENIMSNNTRRMICAAVYRNETFLKLTPTAQSLYSQMVLEADDDGIVASVFCILRITGYQIVDLQLLVEHDFVLKIGNFYVITDWLLANKIDGRVYTQSLNDECTYILHVQKSGRYTTDPEKGIAIQEFRKIRSCKGKYPENLNKTYSANDNVKEKENAISETQKSYDDERKTVEECKERVRQEAAEIKRKKSVEAAT